MSNCGGSQQSVESSPPRPSGHHPKRLTASVAPAVPISFEPNSAKADQAGAFSILQSHQAAIAQRYFLVPARLRQSLVFLAKPILQRSNFSVRFGQIEPGEFGPEMTQVQWLNRKQRRDSGQSRDRSCEAVRWGLILTPLTVSKTVLADAVIPRFLIRSASTSLPRP